MALKKSLAPVVTLLAIVGVVYLASHRRGARFANLDVPEAMPAVYVQMDVGSREGSDFRKCLVSSRSGTTAKRSESRLAKASWRCRVEGEGWAPVLVADSKEQPSAIFVPQTLVGDLAFPLVYEVVRDAHDRPLPAMRWVRFYFERQFRGLYLQVFTPGRAFAAEHQLGRPEILAVSGDRLVCFDRKLRPVCPTYNLAVADAVFPEPRPSAGAALLHSLLPEGVRTFVISELDYTTLEPFPLPVVLEEAMVPGEPWVDARYRRWWEGDGVAEPGASDELFEERAAGNRQAIREAVEALEEILPASCGVQDCDPEAELERLRGSPAMGWLAGALAEDESGGGMPGEGE